MPVLGSSDPNPRLVALEMAVQKLQEQNIGLHWQLGEQSQKFDRVVEALTAKVEQSNAP